MPGADMLILLLLTWMNLLLWIRETEAFYAKGIMIRLRILLGVQHRRMTLVEGFEVIMLGKVW